MPPSHRCGRSRCVRIRPGRPDWQQSACADFARAGGNGLGLRVRAADAASDQGAEEVRRLVER
ncbi:MULTISPECIES: hypothetical protein [unclassified Streptomyces]|uniref:hypothetical protein n=1 Tax=unclassified Streptomyces TaxID=2593676 RepID=UPI002255CE8D|nr:MULTISPECIES: hypothetical protein [unclassified Streptomyces]MCX4626749.1 hypothetical protein [Streptomyces sp. NBC_01443]WSW42899.1 hypothetical protein OG296_07075 [Streptomyces sp. NBC_01001]